MWAFILEAIGWGLLALLTPCVFPMIPMTVSFFLKQNEKNPAKGKFMAILYGICIVLIYTIPIAIIILLTYLIGGGNMAADIFNWLATSWINVLFFLIFVLLAGIFAALFFTDSLKCIGLPWHKDEPVEQVAEAPEAEGQGADEAQAPEAVPAEAPQE